MQVIERRCDIFNIIMHYPDSTESQRELAKKVATVHAQTVIERIKLLLSSEEQKAELIEKIKRIYLSKVGVV